MHWIGTSGFQYPEWKGKFYPAHLTPKKMLRFYSERFNSTEINYTFRRLPSADTISSWAAETPAKFRFSCKAPQRITHFARLVDCEEILSVFIRTIAALNRKLGVVLFQLPPNFKKDTARLAAFLPLLPRGLKSAFEFRNESWFDDEVFSLLRRHKAALCIAESEDLKTPAVSTTNFGYLRLRREDYTRARLRRWAAFVNEQAQWQHAFVYFKHEEKAVGPKFAAQFESLLQR